MVLLTENDLFFKENPTKNDVKYLK